MRNLTGQLKLDYQRLFSKELLLSIGLFVILKLILVGPEALQYGSLGLVYLSIIIFDELYMGVFGAFLLIAFANSYMDDLDHGFIKNQITRSNIKTYAFSKIFVLTTSFLVISIGSFLIIFLILSLFYPINVESSNVVYNAPFPIFSLEQSNPLLLLLVFMVLRSLYLVFLAQGSFFINLYLKNKVLLYMLPSLLFAFSGRIKSILEVQKISLNLNLISQGLLDFTSVTSVKGSVVLSIIILILPGLTLAFLSYRKIIKGLKDE